VLNKKDLERIKGKDSNSGFKGGRKGKPKFNKKGKFPSKTKKNR
jgi:hypothetical protein